MDIENEDQENDGFKRWKGIQSIFAVSGIARLRDDWMPIVEKTRSHHGLQNFEEEENEEISTLSGYVKNETFIFEKLAV